MFPVDFECISTMISFEHLNLMCHSKTVPTPPPRKYAPRFSTLTNRSANSITQIKLVKLHRRRLLTTSSEAEVNGDQVCGNGGSTSSIVQVPFPFDLLSLLSKCQQVEVQLSSLQQGTESRLPNC